MTAPLYALKVRMTILLVALSLAVRRFTTRTTVETTLQRRRSILTATSSSVATPCYPQHPSPPPAADRLLSPPCTSASAPPGARAASRCPATRSGQRLRLHPGKSDNMMEKVTKPHRPYEILQSCSNQAAISPARATTSEFSLETSQQVGRFFFRICSGNLRRTFSAIRITMYSGRTGISGSCMPARSFHHASNPEKLIISTPPSSYAAKPCQAVG